MAVILEILVLIIKLLLSVLLGAIIGYEREMIHRPAGLRTHMMVSLGSTLFTILSLEGFLGSDPARVASNIVVGLGFIGAGTVIQTKQKVIGLTTAASIWVTGAIGMAVGAGFHIVAIITAVIAYFTLRLSRVERKIHKR